MSIWLPMEHLIADVVCTIWSIETFKSSEISSLLFWDWNWCEDAFSMTSKNVVKRFTWFPRFVQQEVDAYSCSEVIPFFQRQTISRAVSFRWALFTCKVLKAICCSNHSSEATKWWLRFLMAWTWDFIVCRVCTVLL